MTGSSAGNSTTAVRHKLLAEPNLTLDKAAKNCRGKEAAQQTRDSLPSYGQVNAARHQSSYKRRQASSSKSSSGLKPPPTSGSRPASSSSTLPSKPNSKCSACGRTPHTKNPCPALTWEVWQVPPERPLWTHVPEPTSTADAYSQSGTPLSESCLQLQPVCFRFRGHAAGARDRPVHPQMAS